MGNHEVFICYNEEDEVYAYTVCNALEENGIKCWMECRDGGITIEVDEIEKIVKESKAFVLIFSHDSNNSNIDITEADYAYAEKMPMLAYNIDGMKFEGSSYEFFIDDKFVFDGHKNPEDGLDDLVRATSEFLRKPVSKPSLSEKTKGYHKKAIKITKQHIRNRRLQKIFSKSTIPIIALVGLLVIGAGIFAFMNYDDGIGGTSEAQKDLPNITMKITDFHVNDLKKKSTDWNYSYVVAGTLSPQPGADEGYKIAVDYYGKNGKLVNSTENQFKDAQIIDNGFLFGSTGSATKDIKRVECQLVNDKDIVIAQAEKNL